MMTGLLPVTEGSAKLFGKPMGADDMEARQSVGYMSQAFSLYGELTVRQNLELHAHLYHLPANEFEGRIEELLERYDLKSVADAKPESLPLGVKQRLQLAVAVLHRPPMLILDEPTSGVDPVARDAFWRTLIDLSRDDGVTIFLSTHFMNEAERCDRISLMHQGRVSRRRRAERAGQEARQKSLEDAFISYLEEAAESEEKKKADPAPQPAAAAAPATAQPVQSHAAKRFDPGRLWAYARRETMELLRDPIRLTFAFIGPVILMLAFGYGITFDVENLKYAAFDQDQTPESRRLLESFSGSHYFSERPPISSTAGTRATHAERSWLSPSKSRPALAATFKPAFARGRLLDRWRHAFPRRDNQRVRDRTDVALWAGPRGRAPGPERRSNPRLRYLPNIENRFVTTRVSKASSRWFRASL